MRGPTTAHDEIRRWAEIHNAVPCEILPHVFNGEPAVLRLTFGTPPKEAEEVRPITWESFFAQFDLLGLVFLYEPDRPEYVLLRLEEKTASNMEVRPN
jgi:hypothetical protein